MLSPYLRQFIFSFAFLSTFNSLLASEGESCQFESLPSNQTKMLLGKISLKLQELLGGDTSNQPNLLNLRALPSVSDQSRSPSPLIQQTLRKSMGYNQEDFRHLRILHQSLKSPMPLYSYIFTGKEIDQPILTEFNQLFQELYSYEPSFKDEPVLSRMTLLVFGQNSYSPFSFGSTFGIGTTIVPTELSSKIRDILRGLSYWEDSQTYTTIDNSGACPPTFSILKTPHYTSIVTRVATDATDPSLKLHGGNLSIEEALKAIVGEYADIFKAPFQILIPIAQSQGTRRHFILLAIRSTADSGLVAKLYDPKYLQFPYDLTEIYKQVKEALPKPNIEAAYYANHQAALNFHDCGRYVAAYIYLAITENLFPDSMSHKIVHNAINSLLINDGTSV